MVGCLGVDTVTKTMPARLAKVQGLRAECVSANLYTGSCSAPSRKIRGCWASASTRTRRKERDLRWSGWPSRDQRPGDHLHQPLGNENR